MIFIVIPLLCVVIILIIVKRNTLYETQIQKTAVADVATWNVKVNGEEQKVQKIELVPTTNNETLEDNKIAPGTEGSFNIVVDATGTDIVIDYNVRFVNESNKPRNLKFIFNNQEYNSVAELEKHLSGIIDAKDENKVKTMTVYWQWKYETGNNESEIAYNDEIDTQDIQNIANYTFDVIVVAKQENPKS